MVSWKERSKGSTLFQRTCLLASQTYLISYIRKKDDEGFLKDNAIEEEDGEITGAERLTKEKCRIRRITADALTRGTYLELSEILRSESSVECQVDERNIEDGRRIYM